MTRKPGSSRSCGKEAHHTAGRDAGADTLPNPNGSLHRASPCAATDMLMQIRAAPSFLDRLRAIADLMEMERECR